MLEIIEGEIHNGQSKFKGSIGHKTENDDKQNTENLKDEQHRSNEKINESVMNPRDGESYAVDISNNTSLVYL